MNKDIERIFFTEEEIAQKVTALGELISKDFEGKNPMFVGVLKGCFMFMSDLVRSVTIPCSLDFMAVSSYKGTSSTGAVAIQKDLSENIEGRHIIIVEDIIDSGLTLSYLTEMLAKYYVIKDTYLNPTDICPKEPGHEIVQDFYSDVFYYTKDKGCLKYSEINKKLKLYKDWYSKEPFTFSAKDKRYNEKLENFLGLKK